MITLKGFDQLNRELCLIQVFSGNQIPAPVLPEPNFSRYYFQIPSGANNPIPIDRLLRIDGSPCSFEDLNTPWVLFIENGESIPKGQEQSILSLLDNGKVGYYSCTVERQLPREALEAFQWVTTREVFQRPTGRLRSYWTSELRLLPTLSLKDIRLTASIAEKESFWMIDPPGSDWPIIQADLRISKRADSQDNSKTFMGKPLDRDIFLRGHEAFFSDRDLSAGFEWPHTVYHTLRLDHIPEVKEALRQGLSNPDILQFALVYLIRFRHFALARELVRMIPEVWLQRHLGLAQSVATVHYINGNRKEALELLQSALRRFPGEAWLAKNAIKICILLGRLEAIDPINKAYRVATGQELSDDYLEQFETIHRGGAGRTATVSLCLIIKDEARQLERAILSAKPMADEIIVVDTGSQDDSVTIARKLGAQVYHFPWNNDFSAARNFAIEKASSDYIFFLDGDEYISPFYYLESQTLKKLLPLDPPCAFKLAVGSYFNETDWLFLVSSMGNFRIEHSPVRIFPRQHGLVYKGIIGETVEYSLNDQGIPVRTIPDQAFHLIHDRTHKRERIQRKLSLYDRVANPDLPLLLQSVQDFSYLGLSNRTLSSLHTLFSRIQEADDSKRRIGLHLARLLEKEDPGQVDGLYRQLLSLFPRDWPLIKAYAEYLIVNHRFSDLQIIPLEEADLSIGNRTEKFERIGFWSLQHFARGEFEEAIGILSDGLEEDPLNLFGQSLRFYYLMSVCDLEGALSSLEALFKALGRPLVQSIGSLSQFLDVGETQAALLLEGNYLKERALVSAGLLTLGPAQGGV